MILLLDCAALLLALIGPFASLAQDITVDITTLITITSCYPTVKSCPGRFHGSPSPSNFGISLSLSQSPLKSSSMASSVKPESSVSSSSALTSTDVASIASSMVCNQDNCLRELIRSSNVLAPFCETYTTTLNTASTGLPVTQCSGSSSRISSGCSCLMSGITTVPLIAPTSMVCNQDNCLRELIRSSDVLSSFCVTYTTTINTASTGLPVTQCQESSARISSACSCLMASSAAILSPASLSSTFVKPTLSNLEPVELSHFTSAMASSTQQEQSNSVIPASSMTNSVVTSSSPPNGGSLDTTQSASIVPLTPIIESGAGSSSFNLPASLASGSPMSGSSSVPVGAESVVPSGISQVSAAQGSFTITPESSAPGGPAASGVSFSFTTTNSEGLPTVIQGKFTPSSGQAEPTVASASPIGFSFTSTGINAQGVPFTTLIQGTFTPSSSGQAEQSTASVAPAAFSFTNIGTNSQGVPFTSVIQGTFTPSSASGLAKSPASSAALATFSFTSTVINAQGSPLVTVIDGSFTPPTSGQPAQSGIVPPNNQFTGPLPIEFTSVFSSNGNPFTTVIQGGFVPSTPGSPNPTGNSSLFPFSFPSVGTDSQGNPTTVTLFGEFQPSPGFTLVFPTGSEQPGSIVGFPTLATDLGSGFPGSSTFTTAIPIQSGITGVPLPTPPPTPPVGLSCGPWPQCILTVTSISSHFSLCPGFPFCSSSPVPTITASSTTDLATVRVTSTITTSPPGFLIQETSVSSWTTNTVFTTTGKDGHTTVLPVIVGCPACRGLDLILWNLPKIPNIQWIIPGFPKLPSFHIPCIIFCGGGGGSSVGDNSPPEPPITDPEPNDQSSEVPTSTTSFTSSSSSSSSSSATATSTQYFIQANPNAAPAVLSAFNQTLNEETNPDTLDISEVPEINRVYFWYQYLNDTQVATYKLNPAVASIFTPASDPEDDVEPEDKFKYDATLHVLTTPDNERAAANLSQYHEHGIQKRAIINQTPVFDDIKVYSQPSGVPLGNIDTYTYDQESAGAARIYIIDSGANTNSYIYKSLPKEPDWIWPDSNPNKIRLYPQTPWTQTPGDKSDTDPDLYHGSCMFSRAMSGQVGVAHNADMTIVKIAKPILGPKETSVPNYRRINLIGALRETFIDILTKDLFNKAVVILAIALYRDDLAGTKSGLPIPNPTSGSLEYSLYEAIQDLISNGVVVVTGSGNYGDPTMTDIFISKDIMVAPAAWKSPQFNIITAGATDNNGVAASFSQYGSGQYPNAGVDVWAPGMGVECAGGASDTYQISSGTSEACANVAGMIAYFLGVPKHSAAIWQAYNNGLGSQGSPAAEGAFWSQTVKQYVQQLAYTRASAQVDPEIPADSVKVIYNGEIPLGANQQPVCQAPAGNRKRQESACVPQPTDSSTPSASAASAQSLASVASVASVQSVESAVSIASVQSVASMASVASVQSVASVSSWASVEASASVFSVAWFSGVSAASAASVASVESAQQASLNSIASQNATPPPSPPPTAPTSAAPPPPSTSTTAAPEASCTAVANISNTKVAVWANYITDNGAALEAALKAGCPGLGSWTVSPAQKSIVPLGGGPSWESTQIFQFTLDVTHPAAIVCVKTAIVKAGGPTGTPDCDFTPAITPP